MQPFFANLNLTGEEETVRSQRNLFEERLKQALKDSEQIINKIRNQFVNMDRKM